VQGLLHFSSLFRGSAIGSTPAFGAGYPGSSPGPGAIFFSSDDQVPREGKNPPTGINASVLVRLAETATRL
jgi:hypothetical protein